jgi:hypothetical protein
MRLFCIFLVLYSVSAPAVFAQRQKTISLNYALEPAPNQWSVKYEEVLTERDSVWSVARYSMPERKLVAVYSIFDTSSRFKHGLYRAFHSNSQLADSGYYVEGYKEGWHFAWHPNGQLASMFRYRNSMPIDTGTTWDQNGKIASVSFLDEKGNGFRRDMYPDQQLKAFGPVKGGQRYGRWKFFDVRERMAMEVLFETDHAKRSTCYDSTGNKIDSPCIYDIGPEFEGGLKAWNSYVQSQLIWPQGAEIPGGKGKVVVSFSVHTDGTIGEFEVLETSHPLLSAEALRILKLPCKWKPAIFMNKPQERRYTYELNITGVKQINK